MGEKRGSFIKLLIMLVAVMMAGTWFVDVTLANPDLAPSPYPETPDTTPPSIEIHVPEPSKTYDVEAVPYSITVTKPESWFENGTIHGTVCSVGYFLDGTENIIIVDGETSYRQDFQSETRTITFEGTMSRLSKGNHTLQVWVISESIYHPSDIPHDFYGWWAAVSMHQFDTTSDIVEFSVAEPEELIPTNLTADSSELDPSESTDSPPSESEFSEPPNSSESTISSSANFTLPAEATYAVFAAIVIIIAVVALLKLRKR